MDFLSFETFEVNNLLRVSHSLNNVHESIKYELKIINHLFATSIQPTKFVLLQFLK